ncbi:MAG: DEAD/DEAH box helicase, partial [Gemmatimonadota bacterium]
MRTKTNGRGPDGSAARERVHESAAATPPVERETERAADFASLGLHDDLLDAVEELGFTEPTPIQADAIPPAMEGRDVLGCAMTGSGKTAAFGLPILERLMGKPRGATRALVLAPTRELARQLVEHFEELAVHTDVTVAAVYGGVSMEPQREAFRRGVDVLVATPGRLLDHFQYDYARVDGIEVLVLDEADRMLDMGFMPDIRRVLKHLPTRERQTLMFSATMPRAIVRLAGELLDEPVMIGEERDQRPADGIEQVLYPVPTLRKMPLLVELLERGDVGTAIVFCRTRRRTKRLAEQLENRGIAAAEIHGDRSQAQRQRALEGFRKGRYRVLVGTDVVARGIDIDDVDHVINFDVPRAAEDYVHRVGRTARA